MGDAVEKKAEEALREYLKALDRYDELVGRYFLVRPVDPSKEIVLGEQFTETASKELDEAEAKLTKTRKKWERLIDL